MTSKDQQKELERQRKEIEQALNEQLVDTIRNAGPMNAVAWLGVTLGAFAVNRLLLVAVTGG